MRTRVVFVLFSLMLLSSIHVTSAQDSPPLDEADTAAFITANFNLQSSYNRVLCVSGDGSCVSEITTAVPCLIDACTPNPQTYPVSENFETIQAASDNAQAGDLIIIMPGRYAGVEVDQTGGDDGAYIHFLGWGDPGSVVVDRSADPNKGYLRHHFYFIAAHHYIIQNIAFENAENGAGIFFSGYFAGTGLFGHHIVVQDVYSHDNYSWGLHTTSTNYMLIQDSYFAGSQDEHGMYVSGSGDNMVIRRNVFQNNIASGLQINADPQTATSEIFYWLAESTGDTCGWSEEDVDFTGAATWHDLKDCYDSQGLPDLGEFFEDGISENIIVELNVMYGNGEAGGGAINLASIRHSTVRNNLIYGNSASGIACWDNAYADEKGVGSSEFGCADVRILNNTIVDETGNRGALIINNDARNMQVFNNIIIRDRFDAYEISYRSSEGLQSGNNFYSARYEEETPATAEQNSITGFSVDEGLSEFMNPTFEPWIIETDGWFSLNPNRPDYRPIGGSRLIREGNPDVMIQYDFDGALRIGTEIGAYSGTTETVSPPSEDNVSVDEDVPDMDTPSVMSGGTITFTLPEQGVFRIKATSGAQMENISAQLEGINAGGDGRINISPDGAWLMMESERFDPDCEGWGCLVMMPADLSAVEVIRSGGQVIHTEGYSAVASGGDVIVYTYNDGPHQLDLYAITRIDEGWSSPVVITADSTFAYHQFPAISDDGSRVVFNCGAESFGDGSICEVNMDGSDFRVVLSPENGASLHHPDYAPDGSIVFEGDYGGEQIWRLALDGTEPVLINSAYSNDNSPCVLPDGRIVSLWLERPEGEGYHELKIMNADGSNATMLVIDVDIFDVGLGCGG